MKLTKRVSFSYFGEKEIVIVTNTKLGRWTFGSFQLNDILQYRLNVVSVATPCHQGMITSSYDKGSRWLVNIEQI